MKADEYEAQVARLVAGLEFSRKRVLELGDLLAKEQEKNKALKETVEKLLAEWMPK